MPRIQVILKLYLRHADVFIVKDYVLERLGMTISAYHVDTVIKAYSKRNLVAAHKLYRGADPTQQLFNNLTFELSAEPSLWLHGKILSPQGE